MHEARYGARTPVVPPNPSAIPVDRPAAFSSRPDLHRVVVALHAPPRPKLSSDACRHTLPLHDRSRGSSPSPPPPPEHRDDALLAYISQEMLRLERRLSLRMQELEENLGTVLQTSHNANFDGSAWTGDGGYAGAAAGELHDLGGRVVTVEEQSSAAWLAIEDLKASIAELRVARSGVGSDESSSPSCCDGPQLRAKPAPPESGDSGASDGDPSPQSDGQGAPPPRPKVKKLVLPPEAQGAPSTRCKRERFASRCHRSMFKASGRKTRGRFTIDDFDTVADPPQIASLHSGSRLSSEVHREALTFASHTSAKYSFQESVWDASLFAGYAHMGATVNIMLLGSLLLNIAIQVTLCAIIAVELSVDPHHDDSFTQSIMEWRGNVTSDVARMVCSEDVTLRTDTFQAERYSEAKEFTSMWFGTMETGPLLSALVIFMWTLSVTDVLRGAIDFVMATIHLYTQRGGRQFSIRRMESNEFVIEGVTAWRTAWAIIIGVLQLAIACCLLLSGAVWLSYTKSIPDLLANAVALSYVMQVDELLYQVAVPRRVKALVTNIVPIDISRTMVNGLPQGIPKRAIGTMCFACGFMTTTVAWFVIPHANRMRQLRDDVCPP